MPKSIKITADTTSFEKSIKSMEKLVSGLKKTSSGFSLFSEKDKKLLDSGFKDSTLKLTKIFSSGKVELAGLLDIQKRMEGEVKEEVYARTKVIEKLKEQARISRQISSLQQSSPRGTGQVNANPSAAERLYLGGGRTGRPQGGVSSPNTTGRDPRPKPNEEGVGGSVNVLASVIPGAKALMSALGVGVIVKKLHSSFTEGVPGRVRAQGLGISSGDFNFSRGMEDQAARVGLSVNDVIEKRVNSTAQIGIQGGSFGNVLSRRGFERSKGLEEGKLLEVISQLRPSLGIGGANQAEQSIRDSIGVNGIRDVLGPALDSMVALLGDINETGLVQTEGMTKLFFKLIKRDGGQSAEQIKNLFTTINASTIGASGEQEAFFQNAFTSAGIGGNTIGGTRFARETGGIFGLKEEELEKILGKGSSLQTLREGGAFLGIEKRLPAIIKTFKESAGIDPGTKVGELGSSTFMMTNFMNSILGTKGIQSLQVLKAVENFNAPGSTMSAQDLEDAVMKAQGEAAVTLNDINTSLGGKIQQTNAILSSIAVKLGAKVADVVVGMKGAGIDAVRTVEDITNESSVNTVKDLIASDVNKVTTSLNEFEGAINRKADDFVEAFGKMTNFLAGELKKGKKLAEDLSVRGTATFDSVTGQ